MALNSPDAQRVLVGGVSIQTPPGWMASVSPHAHVPLVVMGPQSDGFHPNLVLTFETVSHDDMGRWSQAAVAGLRQELSTYQLLDVTGDVVDGQPAVMRLAAYALDDRPLTHLQWAWITDGLGWTLTATCLSGDFAVLAEPFTAMARSLTREVQQ